MTILVTGGAGYIGSHVVKALVEQGAHVVVVDNLYNGYRRAVQSADLVVGDIGDEALIRRVCKQYQVSDVIHFAALKSVGESMADVHRYYEWNVGQTVRLVRAVLECGVDKFVFSSSGSVYGSADVMPVSETTAKKPESVYASTKSIIEDYLVWCEALGLRSVSLRYFNASGCSLDCTLGEDWNSTHNLIPRMMKATLTGSEVLKVFGDDYPTTDGTCVRDYIHVEDLANAHLAALGYLAQGGNTTEINVGTGKGHSVMEVISITEEVTGLRVPREKAPRRPGDPPIVYADPAFAKAILNWNSTLGLREIIQSSFNWYQRFPGGYLS